MNMETKPRVVKERKKDFVIIFLVLLIWAMYGYYEHVQVNTGIKLHQKFGLKNVQYEQIQEQFLYDGDFSEEEYANYIDFLNSKGSPSRIRELVIFEYDGKGKKIMLEVTPGLNNMKIIDMEIEE